MFKIFTKTTENDIISLLKILTRKTYINIKMCNKLKKAPGNEIAITRIIREKTSYLCDYRLT